MLGNGRDVFGLVRERLGEPVYSDSRFMVFQGDCLPLMRSLPEGLIDLTVTSPPYNIGKEYESIRDVDKYIDWCADWIGEIHRLTCAAGAFWLNLGYFALPGRAKAIPIPYLLWDRVPFYLMQEIVWNYGAGVAAKKGFSPRNEKFLWYLKDSEQYTFNLDDVRDPDVKYPKQKKHGKLKCNPLGKNPSDVWQFPKVTSGTDRASPERTPHPAQFPLAVIDRIVKACSNPDDVLFDPFLGSGTVVEAALRNGRRAIGFELKAEYLPITAQRVEKLKREASQKSLF